MDLSLLRGDDIDKVNQIPIEFQSVCFYSTGVQVLMVYDPKTGYYVLLHFLEMPNRCWQVRKLVITSRIWAKTLVGLLLMCSALLVLVSADYQSIQLFQI